MQKCVVVNQFQVLRVRQVLGIFQDVGGTGFRVEHDLLALELFDIVVKGADPDRFWSHEAMAIGRIA